MNVILVHGMGRTPLSMMILARRLRKAGLRTHFFGYLPFRESFPTITDRLARRLAFFADDRFIAVGHSLGGLLLRGAIDRMVPPTRLPERLFMLGTPNRSPRLARRFARRRWYRLLYGECGQLLADAIRIHALPSSTIPMTSVAGTMGWNGWKSLFGSEKNDGIVAVSEVRMEGAKLIELPLRHTFMMNAPCIAELIVEQCFERRTLRSRTPNTVPEGNP